MPYTPPAQRSPATSAANSPILSRSHSYVDNVPSSPASTQRPALPRSHSSTSYLHKQRRSPSFSAASPASNGVEMNANEESATATARGRGPSANGSLRPSPSPVNDLLIPSGAITTPPDSSDDEEQGRGVGDLKDLEEALLHINVKRSSSPQRIAATETPNNTPQLMTAARSLSAEARKIAHSRSSSEVMLSKHNIEPLDTNPIITSSDDSDAEDELRMKPPLLRKKSGELVKPALRPSSARRRYSSMPGTPTYSKAVHFDEEIEQVRHFLSVDRPIAVSAGSSPVETTYESENEYPFEEPKSKTPEWEIKLANFPTSESYERQVAPVRVERIFLASDHQTLVGNIACANLSFHKLVVARFTLDYWKTTSEVVAEFNHDVRKKQKDDGYDRFNFNIKLADLANLESKTLLLCVRYQVNGQEFWDNNNSINYQVDFTKKTRQRPQRQRANGNLGAIPRSRHSPLAPRPRSMPPAVIDDDFAHDIESKFEFGSSGRIIGDSKSAAIRLKPKSKHAATFVDQSTRRSQGGQAFSSRYDFGASLSAALSTAQTALGDRSGLKVNTKDVEKGYFNRAPAITKAVSVPAPVPGTRPDALSSDKPDLKSAEYNELIQKFCFFGTPTGKGSPKVATPATKDNDGAAEYQFSNIPGSNQSSAASSPPSPAMPVLADGASDMKPSRTPSPFLSRSTSPGPVTGAGPEDLVAPPYQYGYSSMHSGIFTDRSHTPQACV